MLLRKESDDQADMQKGQTRSLTKRKAAGKGENDDRPITYKN